MPNIKKYWELLKSRESYKKGILDFYGEKENGDIEEVFGPNVSMHLEPLKSMIKKYKTWALASLMDQRMSYMKFSFFMSQPIKMGI